MLGNKHWMTAKWRLFSIVGNKGWSEAFTDEIVGVT